MATATSPRAPIYASCPPPVRSSRCGARHRPALLPSGAPGSWSTRGITWSWSRRPRQARHCATTSRLRRSYPARRACSPFPQGPRPGSARRAGGDRQGAPNLRMFTYDGDPHRTPTGAAANLVTNPDMPIPASCRTIPSGPRSFKSALRGDRRPMPIGVFRSHLANVLRRLAESAAMDRLQCVMASAAIGSPGSWPERLTGRWWRRSPSGAPTRKKTVLCYNPPVISPELGIRTPYREPRSWPSDFSRGDPRHRVRPEPAGHRVL